VPCQPQRTEGKADGSRTSPALLATATVGRINDIRGRPLQESKRRRQSRAKETTDPASEIRFGHSRLFGLWPRYIAPSECPGWSRGVRTCREHYPHRGHYPDLRPLLQNHRLWWQRGPVHSAGLTWCPARSQRPRAQGPSIRFCASCLDCKERCYYAIPDLLIRTSPTNHRTEEAVR
jgi:hypothetical protein